MLTNQEQFTKIKQLRGYLASFGGRKLSRNENLFTDEETQNLNDMTVFIVNYLDGKIASTELREKRTVSETFFDG